VNRTIIKIIFLIGIIQVPAKLSVAGPENDSILLNSPLYREKFYLFTDRSFYASGEMVLFRVFNMSHTLLKRNNWSTVIYVELINSLNTPVAQGKYLLGPGGASGQIMIPDTLTTGSYYIRAYTKWMRNYPPSVYFHVPLAILNPHKASMAGYIILTDKPGNPGSGTGYVNGIACTPDKSSYGKREKVTVQLKEEYTGISPDGYCITTIKDGYLNTDYSYSPDQREDDQVITNGVLYYPETKGLSISGYAIGKQDRQAVAYSNIYLTLLGTDPDCFEFMTDESGKINLSIPHHTGSRDILITVDSEDDEDIQIIMDDEFSREYSGFPTSTVNFLLDRQDLVEEIIVNSQVRKSFNSAIRDTLPTSEATPGLPFYGNPDFRYRTDDYIMLPNLEEFFYELVPNVVLIKDKYRRYLTVVEEYGYTSVYPPLILLDYVPVLDDETILPVSPQRIDYIDIINTVYVRGYNYYGSIISLVSREGDRAGVKLPSNSSFFNYSTFNESVDLVFPDYSKQASNNRIPDLRTTLYWSPKIDIARDVGKSIEFYRKGLPALINVIRITY